MEADTDSIVASQPERLEAKVIPPSERYESHSELGQGAMGIVYKVRDRYLDRLVALKTLLPSLGQDRESVSRFVREARAVGQFQHPNIPIVHELGKDAGGLPYFCMRLVSGQTLSSIIDKLKSGDIETHRLFPFEKRIQIIQQVCDALSYTHSLGYIHRDIKPENIMIGPFGEVQVMDWGLARKIRCESDESANETQTGVFVGTPLYASPEQAQGLQDQLDARSDVYSIGATLYEFCCLQTPFYGGSAIEVLRAVVSKTPPAPESIKKNGQGRVPRELSVLILKSIEKEPDKRFQSAGAMHQELQLVLQGEAAPVCPHTAYKRGMVGFMKFLDNHNNPLVVFCVYLWTASPLFFLGYWFYQWIIHRL